MLHALPAGQEQAHELTTACPCQPEMLRVNWRGVQRPAVYHRPVACNCDGDWWGGDHIATCATRRRRPQTRESAR